MIISSITYRLSVVLALLSVPCFVIGCLAFDTYTSIVRTFAWIQSTEGEVDAYFGLRMVYIASDTALYDGDKIKFDSSRCTESWCEECAFDGKWTVALNIIAAVSALIGGSRLLKTYLQRIDLFVGFVTAVVSAIASLIGLTLFMTDCHDAVDANFDGKLEWGSGAALTNVGMIFMWIVAALLIISIACL